MATAVITATAQMRLTAIKAHARLRQHARRVWLDIKAHHAMLLVRCRDMGPIVLSYVCVLLID